jgi:hypothetical protein
MSSVRWRSVPTKKAAHDAKVCGETAMRLLG